MPKKGGLGRGLGALISEYEGTESESNVMQLKITDVEPNGGQPRKHFDAEKLEALSDSIKTHGVIQPILVTRVGDRYQIVAGERRWRASKLAGLKDIPAIISDFEAEKTMEIALIENLQREDLNPLEEALGYKSLMDRFNMTQEKISERVSKSRSAIANSLRLLNLCKQVQIMLEKGEISTGHAKVLLSVADSDKQLSLAEAVVENDMTVRQLEDYLKRKELPKKNVDVTVDKQLSGHIKSLEENAAKAVGTKVHIKYKNGKGKIEIDYYSDDDLERLLEYFKI